MKKLSRILALSLAIVMILSGCGAQTQEPAKTEEPTTQPSQTTPATTTPSTQPAQTTPTEPKTDDTQSVPAMSLGTKEYSFENVSSAVFNTKLEGDSVAATSEVVNGAYRIAASRTDGESWHLKLESTLATNPGSTYRVTFDFDSDTAGTVKFGDNQSFTIEKGKNTVTGTFKADGDNKYIDLQLGALAPFVVDLYEIMVEEYAPDGSGSTATIGGALRETVTEQHDGGYEVHLTAAETGAKLNIAAAPASDRGVWKAKMLINTGAALEAGKTYRVSLNVGAEKSQSEYEVCFDGEAENAYGALYGRSLAAGGTDRIEYLVTPERSAGELVLRLQLGKTNSASGNVISVSSLKVEEVNVSYRSVTPAITYGTFEAVSEQHADTYTQHLERAADSAVLRIDAVPEKGEVYESKLLIHTGVTPEADKSYAVSFSVESEKETEYEISYNKASEEKGYGAQYGEKLASGEKKTVEYTVAGTDGKGELTIQLMLGKSPAENAVTVSDVKVCEIIEKGNVSVLPEAINYASVGNITSWLFDGCEASLANTDTSATMTIEKTAQSREVWMAKLLADTGVVPEAGKSYRATFTVETNKALDYELCYNSGDVEKGYDVLYGQKLSANAKKTVERIITGASDDNGRLVIQLSVGNAAEGTKITISDIKVEELTSEYTDILPEAFSFNSVLTKMVSAVMKTPINNTSVLPASFAYNTAVSAYEDHYSGDDGDYAVELTRSADSVKASVDPAGERAVWKAKLHINTGVTPDAGEVYRVSFKLNAEKAQNEYEICFDGKGEKDYDALYGQKLIAGSNDVYYVFSPKESKGELIVTLQLGKTDDENGNTITLSDLKVEKLTLGAESALGQSFSYSTHYTISGTHEVTVKDGLENVLDTPISYETLINVTKQGDKAGDLSTSGGSATLKVNGGGANVYDAKLLVKTGVVPAAGEEYKVNFKLNAEKAQSGFEIIFDGDDSHAAYGGMYGQETDAGEKTFERYFKCEESKGELVIKLQIGKTDEDNTFTISDISVVKVTSAETTLTGFNYPVTTAATTSTVSAHYEAQTLTLSIAEVIAWDESTATADISDGSATLNITKARKTDGGGIWSIRNHIDTGIKLEAGAQYQISAKVSATKATQFEMLFSNGSGENDDYNPGGLGYSSAVASGSIDSDNGYSEISQVITVPTRNQYNNLILRFQVGNSDVNTITVSEIKVEKWIPEHDETTGGTTEYNQFSVEANNGTAAELTGDGSSATAHITTPGDDWHIKLYAKPGVELSTENTYRISFNASGANGASVCYKRVDGEETDYGTEQIASSDALVTHIVKPETTGTMEILLKLGALISGSNVKMSNVRIETLTFGQNLAASELVAYRAVNHWSHDEYKTSITNTEKSATVTMNSVPDSPEIWKTKLFFETGAQLEANKEYQISATVAATAESVFEICYNRGETEKGFGALYNQTAKAEVRTITFTVTPTEGGELILQFNLGNVAKDVSFTVSDIKVENQKYRTETTTETTYELGGPVNHWAHSDYATDISNDESSATLKITGTPASDKESWKIKLFAETGAALTASNTYKIIAKVRATKGTDFEICYNNGEKEAALGKREQLHADETESTVEFFATPLEDANLILQFNLGKADSDTEFTIAGVDVIPMSAGENLVPADFGYEKERYLEAFVHEDYAATLSGGENAKLSVTSAPESGREPWKIKLFIETKVKLEKGKNYRISLNVASSKPIDYEICYNNGGAEKGVGALYGLKGDTNPRKVNYDVTANGEADLIIQLSLGNAVEGCEVTVSDVAVEEVDYKVVDAPYMTEVQGPISYWAHESYKASLTGTDDGATLDITSLPEDGREPWKVKYFVNTLVKPQAGESYRVKLDVLSKTEQPFEICYNNNGEEKGYGAQYGLTAPAGENKTYEKIITIPDNVGYADNLILQLSLGSATAENEITVSNLVVEKIGFTGGTDALTKPISYVTGSSLDFWAHEDYEASVAGTGSAAVVNVNKTAENAEPWKIKLFVATGASLEAGKSYRVSASVAAEKAQGFELCFNNGAAEAGYGALYGLKAGEKSDVGGLITVPANMENASDLVLQFNLGNSESGNAITVSDIKVESVELTEGESVLPTAFSFASKSTVNGWAHEDYAVNLTDNGTSATMNITSVPATGREAWKVKMFVETGARLTAGKTYRVRMDVSAQSAINYEICYNNGAVEKGVGALYDLRAGASKSTVTATLTPNANSELIIQLSLGKAAGANAVTVSNVRVEELVTGGAKSVLPAEFKYVAAKEIDYATAEPTAVSSILFPQSVVWMYNAEGSASGTMSTAGGKITYNMTKISKSDGENKITIPDVELKAGKTYTVTFKAKADKNIDCVFVLNRAGEWNTEIYENLGVGTEEKEYTFTTNALDADSAYELLWQFGSSKNNKLRTAEVEIRDVAIYSK